MKTLRFKITQAITTYFFNHPGQYPYVVPLCPVVPCPEIPPAYAAAPATAAVPCSCGQCAQHMYNNHHLTAPSTLIVNRFTEINYFDNPPVSTSPEKFCYEMVRNTAESVQLHIVLSDAFEDVFWFRGNAGYLTVPGELWKFEVS
ncbi:unnamed protein product [Phyllotreta striolata]|uniref:Uncharacterized protein n=1 Tax=Phyllotreta striolata TaxID=444603 RepID=A0A9N9XP80_PHYSR|nr:unnamed protein product [Phyllotreta striolata]